jgi:hypothetical protein
MEPPIPTSLFVQADIGDATRAKSVIPKITMLLIETKPKGEIIENATRNSAKLAPNKTSLSSMIPDFKIT